MIRDIPSGTKKFLKDAITSMEKPFTDQDLERKRELSEELSSIFANQEDLAKVLAFKYRYLEDTKINFKSKKYEDVPSEEWSNDLNRLMSSDDKIPVPEYLSNGSNLTTTPKEVHQILLQYQEKIIQFHDKIVEFAELCRRENYYMYDFLPDALDKKMLCMRTIGLFNKRGIGISEKLMVLPIIKQLIYREKLQTNSDISQLCGSFVSDNPSLFHEDNSIIYPIIVQPPLESALIQSILDWTNVLNKCNLHTPETTDCRKELQYITRLDQKYDFDIGSGPDLTRNGRLYPYFDEMYRGISENTEQAKISSIEAKRKSKAAIRGIALNQEIKKSGYDLSHNEVIIKCGIDHQSRPHSKSIWHNEGCKRIVNEYNAFINSIKRSVGIKPKSHDKNDVMRIYEQDDIQGAKFFELDNPLFDDEVTKRVSLRNRRIRSALNAQSRMRNGTSKAIIDANRRVERYNSHKDPISQQVQERIVLHRERLFSTHVLPSAKAMEELKL